VSTIGANGLTGTGYTKRELDPLDELLLDPQNPRLPRDLLGSGQERLIEILLDRFDIVGLMSAIVASDFLEGDPIAGIEDAGGLVTIREGNRRLAALKLLRNPDLAPDRWKARVRLVAEGLRDETRSTIGKISVEVWSDPDDSRLLNYIGYRHVTGIRPWPPAEKARFIAHMISKGNDYRDVASVLGSKPRHVERHYVAYCLVESAYELDIPGADRMEDAFGVLIRSLQTQGIPEFLGLRYTGIPADAVRPIKADKQADFGDFVRWTFGTEEIPKVLEDSRDLTKWSKILSTDLGVAYLRRHKSPSFDRAWQEAGGESETIRELLLAAADNMRDVVAIVPDHKAEDDVVQAFAECARFFARLLPQFPDVQREIEE
jgi:hypothetical protein